MSDTVRALIGLVGHNDAVGRVFNVGSTEEITILDLAERVRMITGSHSTIQLIPYDQAYAPGFEDMRRRVPDITRIHSLIGWRPQRDLDAILADVAASMSISPT